MTTEEERIGLFLDYENLAIGARENLNGMQFDLRPVAHALADRGRVVTRKAYADWSYFEEDRRMLTRNHVELIEIPQRMGASRKNAADIKLCVDAIEMAYERDFITIYVICTGDSDFTPLVDKLRALNKRVIGVGVEGSTSRLLPAACDEFLFYERLDGVEVPQRGSRRKRAAEEQDDGARASQDLEEVGRLVAASLTGLERTGEGAVHASQLKRALLRKDATFSEADFGFRGFRELLDHLEEQHVITTDDTDDRGDPEITFPEHGQAEADAFNLLHDVVANYEEKGPVLLSGLKNKLRRREDDFSEKKFGFSSFLQFVKAGKTRGVIDYEWDPEVDDYKLKATPAP